jgi:transcription-repair coupling factor (superfamily II helicase)
MKDLELRGSGNILGKEQSGNINKIGLNLYCQMLNETMEALNT